MGIVIGGLRLIQIGLGQHKIGIIILNQGRVLPVLQIVQGGLRIDQIGLRRGDGQPGIRDRFRRS